MGDPNTVTPNTLRANSLLITIYGDAIAPCRQWVWLGSLITLVELLVCQPGWCAPSAFQLTADEWFVATRIGRRSYYGLSQRDSLPSATLTARRRLGT